VFDERGRVTIDVIRGRAGTAGEDPHRVDGLSGATITSRGVTAMLRFWLGDQGFGPYLATLKEGSSG
jgi:Na+-transporting NADH:ubiquinone oxidoreductase subunit C